MPGLPAEHLVEVPVAAVKLYFFEDMQAAFFRAREADQRNLRERAAQGIVDHRPMGFDRTVVVDRAVLPIHTGGQCNRPFDCFNDICNADRSGRSGQLQTPACAAH